MSQLDAAAVERLVYAWCTGEARGSPSARALAAIYASSHMDEARLLRFSDLRALDETRLSWALAMIRAHAEGVLAVPWPRAVALAALYELFDDPKPATEPAAAAEVA